MIANKKDSEIIIQNPFWKDDHKQKADSQGSSFNYDGKDEFGDRLANGIYFYKVFTGIEGETIEKRETQADQYFKKGYGKMVLIGN